MSHTTVNNCPVELHAIANSRVSLFVCRSGSWMLFSKSKSNCSTTPGRRRHSRRPAGGRGVGTQPRGARRGARVGVEPRPGPSRRTRSRGRRGGEGEIGRRGVPVSTGGPTFETRCRFETSGRRRRRRPRRADPRVEVPRSTGADPGRKRPARTVPRWIGRGRGSAQEV